MASVVDLCIHRLRAFTDTEKQSQQLEDDCLLREKYALVKAAACSHGSLMENNSSSRGCGGKISGYAGSYPRLEPSNRAILPSWASKYIGTICLSSMWAWQKRSEQ